MHDKNLETNLKYWSDLFPEIGQTFNKLNAKLAKQELVLQKKDIEINQKTRQLITLKRDYQILLTKYQKLQAQKTKIVEITCPNKLIWQYWHQFLDKTKPDYQEPNYTGNIEVYYINQATNLNTCKNFADYLNQILLKQNTQDKRFNSASSCQDLLREIAITKL